MDDATALIASMRAKPEEDTPRLAYADLVEERGQHLRAELIRVQVARARLHPKPRLPPPLVDGTITGIPDPVRSEADALDARAAELLLRLPAPTWCPVTFNWHFDENTFAAQAANPEPWVLVRRGFVEHVRCPWDHWLDWVDWFRANHPCERVTLTTMPETRQWRDPEGRVHHFRIKEVPGEVSVSEEELTLAYDHGRARIRLAVTRLLARHWSGTTFAIP
jgi:uncharacterized protein (TIGR02996 family)